MRESVGVNKSTVARPFNVRLRSLSVSLNKPVMVCNKLCLVYLTGLTQIVCIHLFQRGLHLRKHGS